MYGPGRVKVACCKPCCRTKAKKKTIKKKQNKNGKENISGKSMKENKFAAAQMKVFLVTRIPVMSFFWPKTIRKNKATKQEM